METNKNPFPQIELLPRLAQVGKFIGRLLTFLPQNAPDFMSNHYHPENRGGGPALDRSLYDEPQMRLW